LSAKKKKSSSEGEEMQKESASVKDVKNMMKYDGSSNPVTSTPWRLNHHNSRCRRYCSHSWRRKDRKSSLFLYF
jgi:hypothetical protein